MKKKILVVLVMTLLISTMVITVGSDENQENILNSFRNSVEVVDQDVPASDIYGWWHDPEYTAVAQSFIPQHSPLTKIRLYTGANGNPPKANYTISLTETLDGEPIVSDTVYSEDFIYSAWDIVFPDTELIIGQTYYFTITTDTYGGYTENFQYFRSIQDTYENGEQWEKHNGEWQRGYWEDVYWDLSFTTYWRDYAPDNPLIDGPPEGKAQERYGYTFSTDDPEGHEVEYQIDWGDGITTPWLGSYESGEEVEKEHQWAYENNYTIRIRARDVYGAESEWTSMEINMPKARGVINPFIQFLESHPYLFPLLQRLLGI
jgi:hypothetical protein